MQDIGQRLLHDKILGIALGAALLSLFVGRPTADAVDWSTILALLALMICVQLLNRLQVLDALSNRLLAVTSTQRQVVQLFTGLAFTGAMVLTNDVTILTLLPMLVLVARQQKMALALPAVLVVMAANLGSAFTPFGNPQNLYLFAHYQLSAGAFFRLSSPLLVGGVLVMLGLTYLARPRPIVTPPVRQIPDHPVAISLALGLFGLVLLGVFRVLPLGWVTLVAVIGGLLLDRRAVQRVDYGLLLTFICFFILVSAISHNPQVIAGMQRLMRTPHMVYLTSLVASQFISNVPTTVLLAPFTSHATALFWGVNVGGLGTLVASLANLLTLKQLLALGERDAVRPFFKLFTVLNALGLLLLGSLGWFWLR
ncbi:anion permease [Lactobacillus sp. PFC-70]|nr:anion permease [Lactobacillus sp. PFC-70]